MKLLAYVLIVISAPCLAQPLVIKDFKDKPSPKWKFKTTQPILSSPIIDENVVYFGGCDSTLYALQLKDSKVLWKFKTKGQIRSTVLVDGSHLYVNGGDGNLYKLEKKNGKVLWTYRTKGEKKYDFADYHQ